MNAPKDFNFWNVDSIISAFEKSVNRTPSRIAVVDGDFEISYQDLNENSNQLSYYLKRHFHTTDRPIAVFVPKSYYYLLACLSSLKTGRSYIHIDTDYTQETILKILNDNNPEFILTISEMKTKVSGFDIRSILVDQDFYLLESRNNPELMINPNDTAIIGYTSGTTGNPKGVAVSHRACLYAFCKFWEEVDNVKDKNNFGYLTYLAWDALSPLIFSATGFIIPDDLTQDFSNTLDSIEKFRINHIFFTPSLLSKLLVYASAERLQSAFQYLKIIWLGGEIIQSELILKMKTLFPDIILLNNYGPTEFFVVSQGQLNLNDASLGEDIPAGRILPEIDYVFVDENLNDTTLTGSGFLCVAGPAIANGYVNNDLLTKEKFFKFNNKLYYLTGDYCKVLNDGRITVQARQNQILASHPQKNFLKHIEAQFLTSDKIKECVAILTPINNGKISINVYYSTIDDQPIANYPAIDYTSEWNVEYIKVPFIPLHPTSAKVHYSKLLQFENRY